MFVFKVKMRFNFAADSWSNSFIFIVRPAWGTFSEKPSSKLTDGNGVLE